MQAKVKNIGPVKELELAVPEAGGIVVLRGRNGRGKTKTIEALESALSGRGKLEVRDGALSGEVEAFGVAITVGRSARRRGQLEVETLDGRLSVADLVDPGIKSADAADARRIKALLTLAGAEHSPALFYSLLGGREAFEAVASPPAIAAGDLVAMAERLKRDIEAHARIEEDLAENAEGQARGILESCPPDMDLQQSSDPVKLQADLEAAIRVETSMATAAKEAAAAETRAMVARQELAKLQQSGVASVEQCKQAVALWEKAKQDRAAGIAEIRQNIANLTRELAHAEQRLAEETRNANVAFAALSEAEGRERSIANLSAQINRTAAPAPEAEDLAEAAAAVTSAREAVERGALIRATLERREKAKRLAAQASTIREKAIRLREAAGGVDEVLSGLVGSLGTSLRVEAGRLVLDTERGATYFGELSHGERWKLALDIAIKAVGPRGVLPIPQEAWEGLDPVNRQELANHVRGRGVVILTAQASEDETITSEVL